MNIADLATRVERNPDLSKKISEDPGGQLKVIAQTTGPAYVGDRIIYRVVVITLALIVVTAAVGAIFLEWNGKNIPESLIALGSAAIGALAGLLAPSPVRQESAE